MMMRMLHVLIFMTVALAGTKVDALHLTGVTVAPDHLRADVWISFFHELIAEIADLGQFSYNIRTLPSAKHSIGGAGVLMGDETTTTTANKPDGLIDEVYHERADFAIADLEITDERKEFVEFTRPFLRSKLAALVRRYPPPSPEATNEGSDDNKSSTSLSYGKDISNNITSPAVPVGPFWRLLQQSKRGVVAGSVVEQYFRTSKNSYVYHLLPSNVTSLIAGVRLVNNSADFALIADSVRLDLIAAHDCHFKVVTPVPKTAATQSPSTAIDQTATSLSADIGADFELQYAIAFKHDSDFTGLFDSALTHLEQTGKLAALIAQHWNSHNGGDDDDQRHVKCDHKLSNNDNDGEEQINSVPTLLQSTSIFISMLLSISLSASIIALLLRQ